MPATLTPTSKVFFAVSMSLDGYVAPAGMDLEHADDPSYKDWGRQWAALQSWVFPQRFFRENLDLGGGGETGPDNTLRGESSNAPALASSGSGCSTAVSASGPRRHPSTRQSSS